MYDAYVAEQQGNIGDSPVVAEHERLQAAVKLAEQDLQRIRPEFERVKRNFEAAKSDAASHAQKLDDCFRSHAKITEDQAKLENECRTVRDRLQWAKGDYLAVVQEHTSRVQQLSWFAESNQLKGIPEPNQSPFAFNSRGTLSNDVNRELQELTSEVDRLEKLARNLRADQELIQAALAKQDAIKTAALKQRSLMLLDPSVAGELVFE